MAIRCRNDSESGPTSAISILIKLSCRQEVMPGLEGPTGSDAGHGTGGKEGRWHGPNDPASSGLSPLVFPKGAKLEAQGGYFGMTGDVFGDFHALCDFATKATETYSRLREISVFFAFWETLPNRVTLHHAENYAPIACEGRERPCVLVGRRVLGFK
ncbi:hypothetical protein K449DRAFT_460610 [Hypoxylon sp. EC38]|nr:hypothetical protein K449DRAFT_460610 [Hypoxylon sp. EC38]